MRKIIQYLCFVKIPSKHIENAVDQIASLPGIGRKTALRLVLNLLNRSEEEVHDFSEAFLTMKSNVKKCISCRVLTWPFCSFYNSLLNS